MVKVGDVFRTIEFDAVEPVADLRRLYQLAPALLSGLVLNHKVESVYPFEIRSPLRLPAVSARDAHGRLLVIAEGLPVRLPFDHPSVSGCASVLELP